MEYLPAKSIITTKKDSSWFGTHYNMNLYRGCCHSCIYCDSRSDCYRIDKFEQVRAKENALETIRGELRRKVKTGVIATGSMSDPYNPFEETELLTRHALELIDAFGFGVTITTKSDLVVRDLDILESIREHSPVLCKITVTTPHDSLARIIEPGAPSSSRRLEAVRRLSQAGICTGVLLMPVLPWITDARDSLMELLALIKEAGGRFVYPAMGMTLRDSQRAHYYEALDRHFPGLKERYNQKYGQKYSCGVPGAGTLYKAVAAECDRLGLLHEMRDIVALYKMGYSDRQLSFFQ